MSALARTGKTLVVGTLAAAFGVGAIAGVVAERALVGRALRRIGDDDEVISVLISTIRSLDGDLEALLNHLWLHRPAEVKAPPDRPSRGQ